MAVPAIAGHRGQREGGRRGSPPADGSAAHLSRTGAEEAPLPLPEHLALDPEAEPHALPHQEALEDPIERSELDVAKQLGVDVDSDCAPTEIAPKDRCAYISVVRECKEDVANVDYLSVLYCKTSDSFGAQALLQLVALGWLAVLFQGLAIVAEHFLVPAIRVLSDHWRLPPDIAGVTLLSMAAGAPDVFTELAAVNTGQKVDYLLAVSSVVGSALFINCVVFAVLCIGGGGTHVHNTRAYCRDAGTNFLATLAVAGMSRLSAVGWVPAGLLLVLYVVYILVVFLGKSFFVPTLDKATIAAPVSPPPPVSPRMNNVASSGGPPPPLHKRLWYLSQQALVQLVSLTMPELGHVMTDGISRAHAFRMAACTPIFILYVIGFSASEYGLHTYCIVAASSALLSCTLVALASSIAGGIPSPKDPETDPSNSAAAIPTAAVRTALYVFVLSGLWMNLIADELVAILHALGHANGLRQDFLGVSVLGIGESIGDFVAMFTVARQGQVTTAISACFAGPAFNMLVGLSVAFLYYIAVHQTKPNASGPVTRIRSERTPLLDTLLVFTLAINAYMIVAVPLIHKFRLSPPIGYGFLFAYAVFLVATGFIAHYE